MIIGYARVSTEDQDLVVQIKALEKAGCEKMFIEKESGMNNERTEFKACLDYLRRGDTLVVANQSRLTRDMMQAIKLNEHFKNNEVKLVGTEEKIDTSTPDGEFMYNMRAVINQHLRNIISFNTKVKLQHLKDQGIKLGRPVAFKSEERFRMFLQCHSTKSHTTKQICDLFGIAKSTVNKYVTIAKKQGIYPNRV